MHAHRRVMGWSPPLLTSVLTRAGLIPRDGGMLGPFIVTPHQYNLPPRHTAGRSVIYIASAACRPGGMRRSEPDVEPDVGRGPRRPDPHAAPEGVPESVGERPDTVEAAQPLPQEDELRLRQRFVRDDVEPEVPPLEHRLHGLRDHLGTSISGARDGSTPRATRRLPGDD